MTDAAFALDEAKAETPQTNIAPQAPKTPSTAEILPKFRCPTFHSNIPTCCRYGPKYDNDFGVDCVQIKWDAEGEDSLEVICLNAGRLVGACCTSFVKGIGVDLGLRCMIPPGWASLDRLNRKPNGAANPQLQPLRPLIKFPEINPAEVKENKDKTQKDNVISTNANFNGGDPLLRDDPDLDIPADSK